MQPAHRMGMPGIVWKLTLKSCWAWGWDVMSSRAVELPPENLKMPESRPLSHRLGKIVFSLDEYEQKAPFSSPLTLKSDTNHQGGTFVDCFDQCSLSKTEDWITLRLIIWHLICLLRILHDLSANMSQNYFICPQSEMKEHNNAYCCWVVHVQTTLIMKLNKTTSGINYRNMDDQNENTTDDIITQVHGMKTNVTTCLQEKDLKEDSLSFTPSAKNYAKPLKFLRTTFGSLNTLELLVRPLKCFLWLDSGSLNSKYYMFICVVTHDIFNIFTVIM